MKKHKHSVLLLALFVVSAAIGLCGTATVPLNLSPRGVADWAIVGGWIGSGTGALPAVSATGSWYVDLSTATTPLAYRSNGASWIAISSTGTGGTATDSSASLSAHIADYEDPHGAAMTVSQSLSVGSGTADAYIERVASGTLLISSYTVIAPEAATPTNSLATGTLWYDSNTNKLRCYDGTSWNDCW
jgi:hypothetical protein